MFFDIVKILKVWYNYSMDYLNSLKLNGYNQYGCGTIAIHNALLWANELLMPSIDKNLEKISKMIQERNHNSKAKNITDALKRLKKKIDAEHMHQFNINEIISHLKSGGSAIILTFKENETIGHYEFYRYEDGILFESDKITSFIKLKRKTNIKHKYTPEAWLIS